MRNTPMPAQALRWRRHVLLTCLAWLSIAAAGVARPPVADRRHARPKPTAKGAGTAPQPSLYDSNRRKYFCLTALSGAISCSVTHSAVVPLDVIKTALQTDASLAGPRAAVATLLHSGKGIGPFFTGLGPTAVGYWLQGAAKFGGYELIKRSAFSALQDCGDRGEEIARKLKLPIMLASAAAAEVVASAALCPLEVVKLRMQTSSALADLGMRKALFHVAGLEGFGVLYRGFVPIALRQGASAPRPTATPTNTSFGPAASLPSRAPTPLPLPSPAPRPMPLAAA